jgi:hypothetical protein
MTPTQGYYVNQGGDVCSIATPPEGCHFLFESKETYQMVSIVISATCEVHDEYVLWPSLEAMSAAGVDVSAFRERPSSRQSN